MEPPAGRVRQGAFFVRLPLPRQRFTCWDVIPQTGILHGEACALPVETAGARGFRV